MKLPKISIITPSYNQGQFIEETILSVLIQGYTNLEYIIIDGASTDNSMDIIKKYQDDLTYWISEPDSGQSAAINKGFRIATGEIVTWLCADDTYFPETLKYVGMFFKQHTEIDLIYGDVAAIDEKGKIFTATRSLDFSLLGLLSRTGSIPQPASFFRRRVISKTGYLDESIYYCMDYEFFLRVALAGQKIKHVPKTLACYRYHNQSKTVMGTSIHNKHNEAMERHQTKYASGLYGKSFLNFARKYFMFKKFLLNLDRYWKYRAHYLSQSRSRVET